MATMPDPVYSLRDFEEIIEHQRGRFPFFAVMIYPPTNGLNQKLSRYISSNRRALDRLTGSSWLVLTVEDHERGLGEYQPSEIYEIARLLGAGMVDIPCLVFFVEPTRPAVKLFRIGDLLPEPSKVSDEDLTKFFSIITDICTSCSTQPISQRLDCLQGAMEREWPQLSPWHNRTAKARKFVVASAVPAATILEAITKIVSLMVK